MEFVTAVASVAVVTVVAVVEVVNIVASFKVGASVVAVEVVANDTFCNTYDSFCNTYYMEMDRTLPFRRVQPGTRKRARHSVKPFWNDQLTVLLKKLADLEKQYLNCRHNGRERTTRRAEYLRAQRVFDKEYRKHKRKYHRETMSNIERLHTENPKEFWQELKKLGPQKKKDIKLEVYDEHGNVSNDLPTVLNKWKCEYEELYNFDTPGGEFDDDFYSETLSELNDLEQVSHDADTELNECISEIEIQRILGKTKKNKSVGMDNLPCEILNRVQSLTLMKSLFDKIMTSATVPSVWKYAIIKLIPKSSMTDPCLPLQYRGISLMSTVCKIFTGVINTRITKHLEQSGIYAEEQNGFRKGRACIDHVFGLTSIIRKRNAQGLPTYVAYIDAEKAFDRVNRNLLFYKLIGTGITGRVYDVIKCLYTGTQNTINLNGYMTDTFDCEYGVRQGDCLSPTLFGLFVNDLVADLSTNNSQDGVSIGDSRVNVLLYADDLALISDTPEGLQNSLNTLHAWWRKWRMKINSKKSQVVHYRKKTEVIFTLGGVTLDLVEQYKYLGVILHEYMDFGVTADVLAASGGRVLGAIASKYFKIDGLGYSTYTKLFHSGVTPILDYCAGVWGYGEFSKIDTVQNRCCCIFLGVHKYSPNVATTGDMGWSLSRTRRKISMLRFWNRVIAMENDHLMKQVFMWDMTLAKQNWASDIKKVFLEMGNLETWTQRTPCSLPSAWALLHQNTCRRWEYDLSNARKLRTYILFKTQFGVEPYVLSVQNRRHRAAMARLRSGILALQIEVGRWSGVPAERRYCLWCNDCIENECHFLFKCPVYQTLREVLYTDINIIFPNFANMTDTEKLVALMDERLCKLTSKYTYEAFKLRRENLYRTTR